MKMIQTNTYVLIHCVLYFASSCFGNHKKPNVLLLVVDDLRPALGVYGDANAYTPNIDSLANKSFVFYNAYSQQALCAPSRNSFLTSRRPDSLHLYDFYSYWRETVGNFTTLPQHFKNHGYFTHSIGKVFHPGASSNYSDDSPYSWSDDPYHPPTEKYKDAKVCLNTEGKREKDLVCPVRVEDHPGGTLPDIESMNAALDFLENPKHLPFFLCVGFHKPHIPLKYPRKYLKYHPLEKVRLPINTDRPSLLPTVAWNPWLDFRSRADIKALNISFPFGRMPNAVAKSIVQSYAAAVTYIDDLIGSILNVVDDNTIIVLTGDHGISLGEHGEYAKYSNFDIATRVPLIIHIPKLCNKMMVSKKFVELVDIFPTLVDLTNVSKNLHVCKVNGSNSRLCTEGESLADHMMQLLSKNSNKIPDRKMASFSQYPRPGVFPTVHPNSDKPKLKQINIMGYSIRTPEFRYTEWIHFDNVAIKPNWSQVIDNELYNHIIDPNENFNLAKIPGMVPIVRKLRRRLKLGWRYKILQ